MLSFRASARGLVVPLIGALLLCALCLQLVPFQTDTGVDRAAGQWLHLPGLLLVAAVLGAALEGWPLFSRARPGFTWILRVENRPLHGCLAAALGSMAALAVALTLAGLSFATLLIVLDVDQGDARRRTSVQLRQQRPYLDNKQDTLVFLTGDADPVGSIRLRPDAFLSGRDFRVAKIEVRVDGEKLHEGWLDNAGDTVKFDLVPPRRVREIEIRRKPGPGLLLRVTSDRLEVESSEPRSAVINCILALLSYLIPVSLALAVMIVGHAHLAMPVNFTAGLVACLLATLLELAPTNAAITTFARGRWLPGEGLAADGLPVVAGAVALTALTALGHWLGAVRRTGLQ